MGGEWSLCDLSPWHQDPPAGASDFEISVLLGPVGTPGPRTVKRREVSWATKSRVVCYMQQWLDQSGGSPRGWVGPWGGVGVVQDTGAGWEGGV